MHKTKDYKIIFLKHDSINKIVSYLSSNLSEFNLKQIGYELKTSQSCQSLAEAMQLLNYEAYCTYYSFTPPMFVIRYKQIPFENLSTVYYLIDKWLFNCNVPPISTRNRLYSSLSLINRSLARKLATLHPHYIEAAIKF